MSKKFFISRVPSEGLLPIVQHIKYAGIHLESLETVENLKEHLGNDTVEASIDGWIRKRLIKMYIDCCKELSEVPNVKVLKKLYNLEEMGQWRNFKRYSQHQANLMAT